jgi:hypothetical protein
LNQPSSGDIGLLEDNITANSGRTAGDTDRLNNLVRELQGIANDPEEMNMLNNLLPPGLKFTCKKSNSILCYFICSSEEQIWQLRCWNKSGRLQTFLESVFTLLAGSSEKISIDQLTWNLDDYNGSLIRLSQLKALGMCFFLNELTCFVYRVCASV